MGFENTNGVDPNCGATAAEEDMEALDGEKRDRLVDRRTVLGAAAAGLGIIALAATVGALFVSREERPHTIEVTERPVAEECGETDNDTEWRRDWAPLWSENSDICGWLAIDGTDIDLPVLMSEEPYYYLDYDIHHEWSLAGALTYDEYNATGNDQHVIIYGHRIFGGGMLTDLQKCFQQEKFDGLGEMHYETPEVSMCNLKPLCAKNVDYTYHLVRSFDFVTKSEFEGWLLELLEDSDARSENARELAHGATRAITCVTCSSDWSSQPERVIVTFVSDEKWETPIVGEAVES